MTNSKGRSVRLFLIDGNPSGLILAEIINWSGHVLSGSRLEIAKFLGRDEINSTGIYFLFGTSPDDADQPIIYIGESDNVRKRLGQHNTDESKVFWEKTVLLQVKTRILQRLTHAI